MKLKGKKLRLLFSTDGLDSKSNYTPTKAGNVLAVWDCLLNGMGIQRDKDGNWVQGIMPEDCIFRFRRDRLRTYVYLKPEKEKLYEKIQEELKQEKEKQVIK